MVAVRDNGNARRAETPLSSPDPNPFLTHSIDHRLQQTIAYSKPHHHHLAHCSHIQSLSHSSRTYLKSVVCIHDSMEILPWNRKSNPLPLPAITSLKSLLSPWLESVTWFEIAFCRPSTFVHVSGNTNCSLMESEAGWISSTPSTENCAHLLNPRPKRSTRAGSNRRWPFTSSNSPASWVSWLGVISGKAFIHSSRKCVLPTAHTRHLIYLIDR